MQNTLTLFKAYPGLQEHIPWIPLGKFPSRVERLSNLGGTNGAGEVWVKRDDIVHDTYGRNKVRKLEFVLADAESRGVKTLITVGGLGSNHTLALTVHSRNLGFRPVLVLFNQPVTQHVRKNLLLNRHFGAEMHYADSYSKLPLIVVKEFIKYSVPGNKPIYVSAGGTTPLSTLGYVNAAFELKEQVERGEVPKPDFIFVAVGTGGTMAGLMLGSILSGLNAKIIGVRVVPKLIASRFTVSRLVNKTYDLIRNYAPNPPKLNMSPSEVIIISDYLGKGYGHRTEKSKEAVNIAAEKGIPLEHTYTGKTFAAFLDFIKTQNSGVFLFWNTFNSVDLDEITRKVDYRTLPQEFHKLFTCRVD